MEVAHTEQSSPSSNSAHSRMDTAGELVLTAALLAVVILLGLAGIAQTVAMR